MSKMKDKDKTKDQLINELAKLRRRISELEKSETKHQKAEEALRESEEKFKNLFDGSSEAMFVADSKSRRFVDCNKKAEELTGYSRNEILSMKVGQFNPKDFQKKFSKKFKELIAGNEIYDEWELLTKDGMKVPVEFGAKLTKAGKRTYIQGILHDITERKQAEEALKESEKKYRDLVEKAGIAIVINDKEGNFKYLNKKFADLFGYSVEEMKHQSIQTLVHPGDVRWVMEFHKARHHSEKIPSRYEFKGVRKDGSTIYLEIDVVKLKEGKSTVGTRAYIWDITDRKMAEEALRESEEKLRSLVVNTSDAIISVNTQGNIVFWNPAAENIFSYSSDEAIGKRYEIILPERSHIAFKKNFKQIVFLKKLGIIDNRAEMIGLRKDGREFPMEVSLSSGITKEGIFFSSIIRDISERKKATDEPRKTYANLKKHNKS